jgi:hypothetical protein
MKLELKHLASYLPYNLKCDIFLAQQNMGTCVWRIRTLDCFYLDKLKNNLEFIQPILRPLSDLNSEIEFHGRKFYPIDELAEIDEVVVLQYSFEFFETSMKYLPHWIVQQLLEWHFDIFGLIENGLAISIHDVCQADA